MGRCGPAQWFGTTVYRASGISHQSLDTRRVFTVVYIASNAKRVKAWHVFHWIAKT